MLHGDLDFRNGSENANYRACVHMTSLIRLYFMLFSEFWLYLATKSFITLTKLK